MKTEFIKNFPKKHPILFHLLLIAVTFLVLLYGVLLVIDSFTRHGEYEVVPDVKGETLSAATELLEGKGFKWEITDSAYSDTYAPGAVIDQEPKAASKVKPMRMIYLMVNATSPRMVTVPVVTDMSSRQGTGVLEGLGFKNIDIVNVYSPYKDLIIEVKADGQSLLPGMRLPLTAKIEVSVGNGDEEVLPDSVEVELPVDSVGA